MEDKVDDVRRDPNGFPIRTKEEIEAFFTIKHNEMD